jgi:hypothetical protein
VVDNGQPQLLRSSVVLIAHFDGLKARVTAPRVPTRVQRADLRLRQRDGGRQLRSARNRRRCGGDDFVAFAAQLLQLRLCKASADVR